jgi:glutamate dehydrogenase (NADP+)
MIAVVYQYRIREVATIALLLLFSQSIQVVHTKSRKSTTTRRTTMSYPYGTATNGNTCQTMTTNTILADLKAKYAHQPTFLQAVSEMALAVQDLLDADPLYMQAFAVMTEPERTISFRVPWMDDNGKMHHNRGWRIQFSRYVRLAVLITTALLLSNIDSPRRCCSVLGPYKGGLRFHPTVDEDVLKFLGFEQIFKNALTGLPLGGGKGGSDFDPKGKSDGEVRRFCQSFMGELYRYLHPGTDVPAGDIGVGGREIGYLYGQYKRLTNRHGDGVLTGKSINFGGSPLRPEATGYGLVYMAQIAVKKKLDKSLKGMRCAVSGSGNVAQYAVQKLLELGAVVVTVSDSTGVLVFDKGMTEDDWNAVMECKNEKRGRLSSLKDVVSGQYVDRESPWTQQAVKFDLALPCATQNEINAAAAERMVANGLQGVLEGANLPTNMEAQKILRKADVLYIPGKASNAGGVGVSGLEMSQNAQRLTWTEEEVDEKLQTMMADIYDQMVQQQEEAVAAGNECTLEQGANRAGFIKVAEAMKELGWLY